MGEEKSWSQRSLEQAAQRKADYEHGYRTGSVFNDQSARGASVKDSERRNLEVVNRHAQALLSRPAGGNSGGRTQTVVSDRLASHERHANGVAISPETFKGRVKGFAVVGGVLFVLYALVHYPGWSYWQFGGATVLAMGVGVLAAVALEAVILFVRHVLPSLLVVVVVGVLLAHFIGGVDVISYIARLLR